VPPNTQTDDQLKALTEVADRIRLVRDYYQVTQQEFATLLGVSRSHLSEVERQRAKPSIEMVVGIASAYPGVRTKWLLSGEGTMLDEAEEKARGISNIGVGSAELVMEIIEELHRSHLKKRGVGLSSELWGSLALALPSIFMSSYSLAQSRPGARLADALEAAIKNTRRAAESIVFPTDPS
jgi:transcriptional regulator with XRE-family HTH domain